MPVFDLSAEEYALPTRLTLSRLQSLMLWPDDPRQREAAQTAAAAAWITDNLRDISVIESTGADIAAAMEFAANAPPLPQIQSLTLPALRRGMIAGRIVLDAIAWRD